MNRFVSCRWGAGCAPSRCCIAAPVLVAGPPEVIGPAPSLVTAIARLNRFRWHGCRKRLRMRGGSGDPLFQSDPPKGWSMTYFQLPSACRRSTSEMIPRNSIGSPSASAPPSIVKAMLLKAMSSWTSQCRGGETKLPAESEEPGEGRFDCCVTLQRLGAGAGHDQRIRLVGGHQRRKISRVEGVTPWFVQRVRTIRIEITDGRDVLVCGHGTRFGPALMSGPSQKPGEFLHQPRTECGPSRGDCQDARSAIARAKASAFPAAPERNRSGSTSSSSMTEGALRGPMRSTRAYRSGPAPQGAVAAAACAASSSAPVGRYSVVVPPHRACTRKSPGAGVFSTACENWPAKKMSDRSPTATSG